MSPAKPVAILLVIVLAASACTAVSDVGGTPPVSGADSTPPTVQNSSDTVALPTDVGDRVCIPLDDLPAGEVSNAEVDVEAQFPWEREDPVVAEDFDFDDVLSGGPPPDGILPIDAPCFDQVGAAAEWLQPQSPVMVVQVADDVRAYPLAIMTQHEIANDVVGGVPLVVTYCPLCNSGLAFERTVDGQVLDFGTSGRLYQSNLIMYDRQTKGLWSQFLGQAVVGEPWVGTQLVRVPSSLVSWQAFAEAEPGGLVLSRDSVQGRDYGRNPYPEYEGNGDGFLFDGPRDDRLPPNTRVVGLGETTPVAVPLGDLRRDKVIAVEVDDRTVSVWWAPGQASALDAQTVDAGQDVGTAVAYDTELQDGRTLTFSPEVEGSTFADAQTGSTWNLLGQATAGPLEGTRLTPVAHDDTFWFVWFAFKPSTTVS